MADDVLGTLPADGKLPDALPQYPDPELARAWCHAYGGIVRFYVLDANKKAEFAGQFEGAAPIRNPYTREDQPSGMPPQMRTLEDLKRREAYLNSLNPPPAEQPDWNWNPQQQ